MKKWLNSLIFICSLLLFVIWTIMVKFVDVQAIGPNGSTVGLASLNSLMEYKLNNKYDIFADGLLLISLFPLVYVAFEGLRQWAVKGKLKLVDISIYTSLISLIILVICYIGFEKIIINYRPILINNILEPSYPSTHTLIVLVLLFVNLPIILKTTKKKYEKVILISIFSFIGITIVIVRALSGVHYLTDIIGSIFLAITIIYFSKAIEELYKNIINKKEA